MEKCSKKKIKKNKKQNQDAKKSSARVDLPTSLAVGLGGIALAFGVSMW